MRHLEKTMTRTLSTPVTEDEIHALVDGQLAASSLAALQERLAQDPSGTATVAQWQRQRNALRNLHQAVLEESAPAILLTAAQRSAASQQESNQMWRLGGMAAGVLLAFGVGWLSHVAWQSGAASPLMAKAAAQNFARQAGFAHAVYSPEKRHPVEVGATEQEHLVQWLSKRLGRSLKVPDLTPNGYELVGGRLLPSDTGARAQFMFQDGAGTRITLYIGAVDKAALGTDADETSFRFASDTPVPSFYWVDQGFGYALTGSVPRDALMQLAQAVYRQL